MGRRGGPAWGKPWRIGRRNSAGPPGAGVENRTIGVVLVSGVAGDIGGALVIPGVLQGAVGADQSFIAGAAVTIRRVVKMGAADGKVIHSAAVGDAMFGVALAGVAQDVPLLVRTVGVAQVEYGAAVTRGDLLTTDANGKAIEADPAAGANNNIVGMALESGVDTDVKSVLISPSAKQGA